MTLIEMLRANGSWEADAAASKLQSQADRIEKLEAALWDIHALCKNLPNILFIRTIKETVLKAVEGKDD